MALVLLVTAFVLVAHGSAQGLGFFLGLGHILGMLLEPFCNSTVIAALLNLFEVTVACEPERTDRGQRQCCTQHE
ncbi:MAG TPA: hypothetical protein VN663_14310 [Ramlibacter sp.]|nr:hypothetical protein [Ramlibacter sp.]